MNRREFLVVAGAVAVAGPTIADDAKPKLRKVVWKPF